MVQVPSLTQQKVVAVQRLSKTRPSPCQMNDTPVVVIDGTTNELDLEHVLRRFVDFCLGAADEAADFLLRTYSYGCRLRCSNSARQHKVTVSNRVCGLRCFARGLPPVRALAPAARDVRHAHRRELATATRTHDLYRPPLRRAASPIPSRVRPNYVFELSSAIASITRRASGHSRGNPPTSQSGMILLAIGSVKGAACPKCGGPRQRRLNPSPHLVRKNSDT